MPNPGFEISKDGSIPIKIRIDGIEEVRASLTQFFKDMQKLAKIDVVINTTQAKSMHARLQQQLADATQKTKANAQSNVAKNVSEVERLVSASKTLMTLTSKQYDWSNMSQSEQAKIRNVQELQRMMKLAEAGEKSIIDDGSFQKQIKKVKLDLDKSYADSARKRADEVVAARKREADAEASLNRQRAKSAEEQVNFYKKLTPYENAEATMSAKLDKMSDKSKASQTTKEYQEFVSLLNKARDPNTSWFDKLDALDKLSVAGNKAKISIQALNEELNKEAATQVAQDKAAAKIEQQRQAAQEKAAASLERQRAQSAQEQMNFYKKLVPYEKAELTMGGQLDSMSKKTKVAQTTEEYKEFLALLNTARDPNTSWFEKLDALDKLALAGQRAKMSIQDLNKELARRAATQAAEDKSAASLEKQRVKAYQEQLTFNEKLKSFDNNQLTMENDLRRISEATNMSQTTSEFQEFVSLLNQAKDTSAAWFDRLDAFKQLPTAATKARISIQNLNKTVADALNVQKQYNENYQKINGPSGAEWVQQQRDTILSYSNADPAVIQQAQAALNNVIKAGTGDKQADTAAQKALNDAMREYQTILDLLSRSNSANTTLLDQQKALANMNAEIGAYMQKYDRGLSKNPALYKQVQDLYAKTLNPDNAGEKSTLAAQWAEVTSACRSAGVEAETTRSRMSNLFAQHFNTAIIMAALNGLRIAMRQLWTDIKDVNEALVQTQIVTGLTGAALENYTDRAYEAASRSKDTVTNILDSATAYGRLGYDSEISVDLAELTSMYAKLGDTDVSSATDAITAMMKAFDLQTADEIEAALDKLIYVGNNFPISASGLGEGLNNAASALASAGNSLEQTLSLLMAANATVQNPAKASTAMRTITARIRNSTAELGELGETLQEDYNTVSKYRDKLLGVANVDILDETGQEFRSTYDILKDLASVWGTLQSTEQATITTMLAGTRNQDIFASIMKNFPEAISAMDGMDSAAGLMDQKFVAVSESISGALSELSNAFSKFSTNLVNSKGIVTAINGLTKLVEILDKFRGFFGTGGLALAGSLIPLMSKTMGSMNFGQYRGIASALGDSANWNSAIESMRILNPLQRQTIMNLSSLDIMQQSLFTDMAKAKGVTIGAAGAFGSLSASLQTAKMGLENFVASGNAWIMLAQAIILLISGIIQAQRNAQIEASRLAAQRQRDAVDQIKSVKSNADEYDSLESSVSQYISQLEQIQQTISENEVGTKAYSDAQKDLNNINLKIIDVFGEEAAMVKGVTDDLESYAATLEKIARKKRWDALNSPENAIGVDNALALYGIDKHGERTGPVEPFKVDSNIALSYKTTRTLSSQVDPITQIVTYSEEWGQTVDEYLASVVGDRLSKYIDWFGSSDSSDWGGLFKRRGEGTMSATLTSLEFKDAESVIEIYDLLSERYDELIEKKDYSGAKIVAQFRSALNQAMGVTEAISVFQDYMDGMVEFGDTIYTEDYNKLIGYQSSFNDAVKNRNTEEAQGIYNTATSLLDSMIATANEKGQSWAVSFFEGLRSQFQTQANASLDLINSDQATKYITGHNPVEDYRKKMSGFNQGIAMDAIGNVGDLGEKTHQMLGAREIYNNVFQKDDEGNYINLDKAEKDIEHLNEFFGTDFKKVTEENAETYEDAFSEMFDSVGEDIYGAIEGNIAEALTYAESNIEGFDIGDYITDDGVDFTGIMNALAALPPSADQAGASSAMALANELKTVAGMKFTLSADPNTGTVTVNAEGGTGTYKPKGGGGGGGKKKKSKYEQDLDALERIIKMLREQLNYYEEGSDQWIARQRKIIDRYKAGVAITMQEYNRLIKSGLKQTDDSVKEIVDKILEYQDDIFKESQNLWEAVRQNQIDSLEHTKDQNDAAIQLENTHHDLLMTIRNERRELEDELEAARNAYSEVMTPAELDALFSLDDYTELMDKLTDIETDAMGMYAEYKDQIAAVSEKETYMVDYITDEFERQYELKMKEYEIAKAELGVAKAQQELDNVRNEQTVMMLKDGMWQWVADPEKVLEAERKLAEAQQELSDAQEEFSFQSMVKEMEANSSELKRQIDALKALTFSMDELANQIHLFSDKIYKELLMYLTSSTQQYFKKYEGSTAVPAFASGGVIARGGLAEVHSGEPIFGTEDAVKLWKFVHNLTPNDISTAQTMAGINRMAVGNMNGAVATNANSMIDNSVTINGMRVDGENAQALIAIMRQVVASYQPITN